MANMTVRTPNGGLNQMIFAIMHDLNKTGVHVSTQVSDWLYCNRPLSGLAIPPAL